MQYNQQTARKSIKRVQLWIFTPHFSKFRAFRTLQPPKRHVFLEFLVENKAFNFSKRAVHADTACNKWFKKALDIFLLDYKAHVLGFLKFIEISCHLWKLDEYWF